MKGAPILTTARNALTAILLSSVAIVPAATVSFVATADAAHAKSEKSQGGGKSAGKSGKSGKASSKGPKSNNGKSGGQSSRGKPSKTLSDLGDDIRGLFGKGKKKSKTVAKGKKATSSVVAEVETPEETEDLFVRGKSGKSSKFHPSELGNMNGAMNANMNAVLAHIRNGNTNGPVGAMALLASARTAQEEAGTYADLYDALDAAGYESLQDYYYEVEPDSDATPEEIEAARAEIASVIEKLEAEEQTRLETIAMDAGYSDLDSYYRASDGEEPLEPGERPDEFTAIDELDEVRDREFEVDNDALANAGDAAMSLEDAETSFLEYWNKNPGEVEVGEGELTPQEQLLIEAHKRLDTFDDAAIAAAIAEGEARAGESTETEGEDEIVDDCVADEDCEPEEELALVE